MSAYTEVTMDSGRRIAAGDYEIDHKTDVLVIGGSLAGAWAALAAARTGARVVLAEKGWMGTAGVVAAASVGGYYALPDDPAQREGVITVRHQESRGLDDLGYVERVYDQSYRSFTELREAGFASARLGAFPGPDSMAFLRRQLLAAKVKILDHSPALELLQTADGAVAGAAGIQRKSGEAWRVRAGAVVLATGGNAFLSGAQGTNGLTGDGYLMGAEAGARLQGMEFSGHYGLTPAEGSCTKGGMYFSGHIYDDAGERLDPLPSWFAVPNVARTLLSGGKAWVVLDKAAPAQHDTHRRQSPNFYQYFSRRGVDPFRQRWPVKLTYEGTVRAAGGLLVDEGCATGVPGLYAAGDVTDRCRLTGAFLSGAGPAVAWCVASGEWAGQGAAAFARALGTGAHARQVKGAGACGLRPGGDGASKGPGGRETIARVQEEILPLEKNFFRDGKKMTASLARLDALWAAASTDLAAAGPRELLKAREAAALAASARWIYRAALARTESRGLHRRSDFPEEDPAQRHHLVLSGVDEIRIARREALPA
ncbi:FAD-binding protein [Azoarcus sp. TTM-91]|uniref:FAD-binding protein n=1 Tax=Azoarcus sp. TTM-91 TaxID=2691581 RepID=UPI002006DBF4|nr:FAD-binding protein [Azoarcus sp. TTM-91]